MKTSALFIALFMYYERRFRVIYLKRTRPLLLITIVSLLTIPPLLHFDIPDENQSWATLILRAIGRWPPPDRLMAIFAFLFLGWLFFDMTFRLVQISVKIATNTKLREIVEWLASIITRGGKKDDK